AKVKAMLEITDPCLATSTSATRSPKSKSSHCTDKTSMLPLPVTLLLTLVPSEENSLWNFCQPCTMPAETKGKKVLSAMPAASAALRASFQALRVVGLFDSATSISSGSVEGRRRSRSDAGG